MTGPARVLLAPDSFKGTMDAATVADALAAGVADAGGRALPCPLADGGEGTRDVLRRALGGELVRAAARGPLGDRIEGEFLLTNGGRTAVVETATASGLTLLAPERLDAWSATSAGTGDLIVAAVAAGARRVLLGVGGSACTDGGAGACAAIEAGGGLDGVELVVLCDVATPFEDSARVFGPQKGADPDLVARLTDRLHERAAALPRDPRGRARTGAAGGLSGALWAAYDARLVSGIETVLDLVGFDALLAGADAVVTGEGRLDAQTADGKVISGVTRRAAGVGVPVWAVVGQSRLDAADTAALGLAGVAEATDQGRLRAAAASITASLGATEHPNP
ncbi:glycerate kinase [Streptosporangium sp. NPDC002544]|uniref:glycerate kinase n=1 Tax=unclassified Streptosporangium TaxID=2632669 RepID=UPI00331DD1D6